MAAYHLASQAVEAYCFETDDDSVFVAQDDFTFRDDRSLPFEGAGAGGVRHPRALRLHRVDTLTGGAPQRACHPK